MAKIQNLDRLNRKLDGLKKIQGRPRALISQALQSGAEQIASSARAFVPSKTRALKRSIKVVKGDYKATNSNVRGLGEGRGDPDLTVRVVAGDDKAWYARLVEFGTRAHVLGGKFAGATHPGSKPTPYFYPAYRANKKRVKAKISRAMNKAIKEIIK